jgi:hypothetical protein
VATLYQTHQQKNQLSFWAGEVLFHVVCIYHGNRLQFEKDNIQSKDEMHSPLTALSDDESLRSLESSKRPRLTAAEKNVVDEMLKNVDFVPSGLRVYGVLVTKRIIWSVLSLIATYCAFIFQMYVGVAPIR